MSISANTYLEFIENHVPALKAGKYRFSGGQTLAGAGIGTDGRFSIDLPRFLVKVEGERFTINPAEIDSVFPPNSSLGHYDNVLPHIAFKRDTLPWERMIAAGADEATETRLEKTPWLALLVLNEEEFMTDQGTPPASIQEFQQAEEGYVKSGKLLETETVRGANWPPHLDDDENAEERFKVIYVKKASLKTLLPTEKGLNLLAHARKSRIRLTGVKAGQAIAVYDDKGALIHQETAAADDCRIDCGLLAAGDYTIHVDGAAIDGQPFAVRPGDQVGGETALVVANRLPKSGLKSVIHLVSLEGRYKPDGDDVAFDFDGYGDAVPLVSLYSWSFTALTEKETFRHIVLSLNHTFLFGIDAGSLPDDLTLDALRGGFAAGRRPLGSGATLIDRAVKELRDKDHAYYFGQSGAVYDAAGRKIAAGNGRLPADRDAAAALIPGHRLHQQTATYGDASTKQLWISDGRRQFFVSEDPMTKRLLVYLLPGDATPSLRLPDRDGEGPRIEQANHFLQQGYVPLPHHFRRGGRSVSCYRGPLLAGKPGHQIPADQFPVHTADELLRYDSTYGLFDASYAAAWELGRLLCLQNRRISLELYRWKRTHVRALKAMEQQHLHPHLPFRANVGGKIALPEHVETWLSEVSLLKTIPFSYLVPDERLLPPESLRFFYLDPSWVASLVDGVLSIGRVDRVHDSAVHRQALGDSAAIDSSRLIAGFLLRSSVVKGWPNLQANAYDYRFAAGSDAVEDNKNDNIPAGAGELPCLRLERLSDHVLLGLYQGEIRVLDIHEEPQTIHLGFDSAEAGNATSPYVKYPIRADGGASDQALEPDGSHDYFDEGARVIRPALLAAGLQGMGLGYANITSAEFALSLMEGVSRVRFIGNGG